MVLNSLFYSFLWFFLLHGMNTGEANNLKMPTGTNRKKPSKSPLPWAKRPGKGQPSRKLLENNQFTTEETMAPPCPCQQRPTEEPGFHPVIALSSYRLPYVYIKFVKICIVVPTSLDPVKIPPAEVKYFPTLFFWDTSQFPHRICWK